MCLASTFLSQNPSFCCFGKGVRWKNLLVGSAQMRKLWDPVNNPGESGSECWDGTKREPDGEDMLLDGIPSSCVNSFSEAGYRV